MTSSQREILKFSLQIIFLTLFIYTGASQRSYHMSQNIYEGNKNSCLLSHPHHVCCFYITVTVTRCGRGGGLSSTDPPLLRSDTPSPAPPGHPPSTLRSYPPNLSWTSAVQCTYITLGCTMFTWGADLTSLPAIMITTNAPCLWEIIAMMAHSCCHTFPGKTCLYLPVQG